MSNAEPVPEEIAAYKRILKALLDLRPSGTRKRLAEALGTHKSFVSQITNPAYRVAIPAHHVDTIVRVCRLSTEERRTFLGAYAAAHPRHAAEDEAEAGIPTRIVIMVPAFRSRALHDRVVDAIETTAGRIIAIARDTE